MRRYLYTSIRESAKTVDIEKQPNTKSVFLGFINKPFVTLMNTFIGK